jgi:hypothetical protein
VIKMLRDFEPKTLISMMKELKSRRYELEHPEKPEPFTPEPTSTVLARIIWFPWSNGPRGMEPHASDLCPPIPRRRVETHKKGEEETVLG